jgi:hypothetical protein
LLLAAGVLLPVALAQSRFYYFNDVGYVFPASQGASGHVLTNDGSGNLSWAAPPTPEGLWSGSVVLSSTSCPAGWTRLAAADARILRAAATAGGTGGSDTHTHTLTGSTGSQGVTVTGSTASNGVSISGSTGTTSISHSHSVTPTTAAAASGSTTVLTGITVNAADPSHSHAAGTLAGGNHSHGVGTLAGAAHSHGAGSLAAGSVSNVPAYYGVIVCVKD